jgi:hypothetical protein
VRAPDDHLVESQQIAQQPAACNGMLQMQRRNLHLNADRLLLDLMAASEGSEAHRTVRLEGAEGGAAVGEPEGHAKAPLSQTPSLGRLFPYIS